MKGFTNRRKRLKARARSKGYSCTISTKELRNLWNASVRCPICQNPFSQEENCSSARSFERLNASIGYTSPNTFVICRRCNSIKSILDRDGSTKMLEKYCVLGDLLLKWMDGINVADV